MFFVFCFSVMHILTLKDGRRAWGVSCFQNGNS
nr:MAG TPA: hypothetical protein [Caudoviricetes sp.]